MRGGGGFDVNRMMKQVQDLQKNMGKVQDELKEMVVEATSGGGMVKAVVNGQQDVLALKIDPEVVDKNDVAMLEDLIVAAVQEATKKSREMAQAHMQRVTGGLGLPPGMLPGM